jgi:hypothetical protein
MDFLLEGTVISTNKTLSGAGLLALSAFVLASLFTPVVSAQHQGHDMSGMDMSKPRPAPQKKKKSAQPKQDDMKGMDISPSPPPAPSSSPTPTPAQHDMNSMPGMQMLTTTPSPSPATSPQQQIDTNTEMPQASPSPTPHGHHEIQQMPAGGKMGNTPMNNNQAMPGMKNISDMGGMKMNMGPLMIMNGDDMDIRVGSSDSSLISMGGMGSGTSWQPASTPMYMYHKYFGNWLTMFHYNAFVGVNHQGGPRGETEFESANWFMPMAFHKLGPGTLQLRGMFSFEPFTFPKGGSGLLFQTGETYKGEPLIDKQHPHDLFMELSATYTVPMGEHGTWYSYFGYPGEPALGPVAFMHRWSASENPSAPLGHHLQDSTHIAFGVFTTGFTYRKFKLEGSVFNGREPDENRYNFEAHPWNSRSARLSYAPNRNWAMQVSYGFLRKPEATEPDSDIRRATASIQYNKPFNRGNWASSLIWGRNHVTGGNQNANLNSYTAESTVNFLDRNYLYTRLELVDKNELLRHDDLHQLGFSEAVHPSFRIGAYTFGGARDIWTTDKFSMAVGSDLTFYSKPEILSPIYGKHPVSYRVFLRFRPGKMNMSGMHGTVTHDMYDGTSDMNSKRP